MSKGEMKKMITEAMGGDVQAFENLYNVFIKSILFHTSLQLYDKNHVDDAVQEIVMRMY
ncbi:MAG: hypothetical protein LBN22_06110 [Clostridiales Family XIII bacterium]|nr:hypothetical protein [Clostridiales Family XIII bacterium]